MDLATAAIIAKLTSDAVGAIDKIFRGYMDIAKKKEPIAEHAPRKEMAFEDSPQEHAFVAKSMASGHIQQTVTYEDLRAKLKDSDREYIETLSRVIRTYEKQWNIVYEERANLSGLPKAQLTSQLEQLAKDIADPLSKVLRFVEKMGLYLDDHYLVAREVAEGYLK